MKYLYKSLLYVIIKNKKYARRFSGMDQKKNCADSAAEQVQIVMHQDLNGNKRLFGGRLMEWIDIVAAVVSRRHCGCEVTTAAVDNLQFSAPAYINDTIILSGKITYAGRTSMEVKVDVYVENLSGVRKKINTAYVVTVAIDENQQPAEVPRLLLNTDEEKREWANGEKRRALGKSRRIEQY
jgi:acyl-CoA hydrolase